MKLGKDGGQKKWKSEAKGGRTGGDRESRKDSRKGVMSWEKWGLLSRLIWGISHP